MSWSWTYRETEPEPKPEPKSADEYAGIDSGSFVPHLLRALQGKPEALAAIRDAVASLRAARSGHNSPTQPEQLIGSKGSTLFGIPRNPT